MTPDTIATIITGLCVLLSLLFGVLFGVRRIVHTECEGLRRDITAQLTAINTHIDAKLGGWR